MRIRSRLTAIRCTKSRSNFTHIHRCTYSTVLVLKKKIRFRWMQEFSFSFVLLQLLSLLLEAVLLLKFFFSLVIIAFSFSFSFVFVFVTFFCLILFSCVCCYALWIKCVVCKVLNKDELNVCRLKVENKTLHAPPTHTHTHTHTPWDKKVWPLTVFAGPDPGVNLKPQGTLGV